MEQVEIIKLEGHRYSHIVICGETVLGYIGNSESLLLSTDCISMSTMETIVYVWNKKVKEDTASCGGKV